MKRIFTVRNIATWMMVILLAVSIGLSLKAMDIQPPLWLCFIIGGWIWITVALFRLSEKGG